MNVFETLLYYFQFPYVRYALIVGVLIALCSSLLGVTLVMKRLSFIGDGLSHIAFGAMAVSSAVSISVRMATGGGSAQNMIIVLPVTLISAVLLLRLGQNSKIKGDALIAMISVSALAIGYLVMNMFSVSSNISGDVCSTLFGATSIITLTSFDMWLSVILSALVVIVFILLYNRLFSVTFDESFARATGMKVGAYNLLIALIIAVLIVLAMNLIGSLLISALVVFPALSAMRVAGSFKKVIILSVIISVSCAFFGIICSVLLSTPVGSTVVILNLVTFGIFFTLGALKRRKA